MPIIATAQVSYLLIKLEIDMVAQAGSATLRKFIDGNAVGDSQFTVVGQDFMALVGAQPSPNKSRGFDIADAIYEYAIANLGIEGSIT